ncbi:MAG: hypothetical protein GEU28_07705 [Dehalococcoidia bacterium]|nr:hypothetical protein [Dehalococcoidia bacterium]
MSTARLELRLQAEHRRKLSELAADSSQPLAQVVRDAIDLLYEQRSASRRKQAVRELASLQIEEMPEPEELARQVASKYADLR